MGENELRNGLANLGIIGNNPEDQNINPSRQDPFGPQNYDENFDVPPENDFDVEMHEMEEILDEDSRPQFVLPNLNQQRHRRLGAGNANLQVGNRGRIRMQHDINSGRMLEQGAAGQIPQERVAGAVEPLFEVQNAARANEDAVLDAGDPVGPLLNVQNDDRFNQNQGQDAGDAVGPPLNAANAARANRNLVLDAGGAAGALLNVPNAARANRNLLLDAGGAAGALLNVPKAACTNINVAARALRPVHNNGDATRQRRFQSEGRSIGAEGRENEGEVNRRGQPDNYGNQAKNDSNRGRRGVSAGVNKRRYTHRLNPYQQDLKNVADWIVNMVDSSVNRTRANLERDRVERERREQDSENN